METTPKARKRDLPWSPPQRDRTPVAARVWVHPDAHAAQRGDERQFPTGSAGLQSMLEHGEVIAVCHRDDRSRASGTTFDRRGLPLATWLADPAFNEYLVLVDVGGQAGHVAVRKMDGRAQQLIVKTVYFADDDDRWYPDRKTPRTP